MCSSPQLIAACHVLLRLSMPRHSPCALISLTFVEQPIFQSCSLLSLIIMQSSVWLHCSFVTLNSYIKSPQKFVLCYLSVACSQFLACFTVQFSRCRFPTSLQGQIETLRFCKMLRYDLVVEISGIEPLTPCLQGRCSPS